MILTALLERFLDFLDFPWGIQIFEQKLSL